jgi:adenosylcobyric acid synthase
MSNNSVVALDAEGGGGEIGRAQALQAAACGLAPSVRFNPVLLKPGSDRTSQVVVLGRPSGRSVDARNFVELRAELRDVALSTLSDLRAEFDVVVCEGAGSPAEINLRTGDYVNMGLARAAKLPTVVVGDIDRGGVFAALYGTLAVLSPEDQALLAGFVINKFRGDESLLAPGIEELARLTGRPTFGVLPWHPDLWVDAEDSLSYASDGRLLGRPAPPRGSQWLRVGVVRLPRISNATDVEALAAEPGVMVRLTSEPSEIADCDVVVLPGTKSTVADLEWLRTTGMAAAVTAHAAAGRPLVGICGGFQMLAERIHDGVESTQGTVAGLGLLPMEVTFQESKELIRSRGTAMGAPVSGYEIHHGSVTWRSPGLAPLIHRPDGTGEGAVTGGVFGTHWHGTFESDAFREAFLAEAARIAGRHGFRVAGGTRFATFRERAVDVLGDLVEEHLDTGELWRLIDGGMPGGLPTVRTCLRPGG